MQDVIAPRLKTPRAAAIAGIIFSVLLMTSLWLLRLDIPADPRESGAWLENHPQRVGLALNLVPVAGVAFMWFLGVLRDRLGAMEDQFFATVFLGSGLMFLGMLFAAAASVGSILIAHATSTDTFAHGEAFAFGRAFAYTIMNVYAAKMAVVFMVSSSTVALKTQITGRWIAWTGYSCALFLLLCSGWSGWAFVVFPAWILLVSASILRQNFRREKAAFAGNVVPEKMA